MNLIQLTKTIKNYLGYSFVKFCLVGLINTAHHYFWFLLLSYKIGPVNSNVIAFILANIGSYFLNSIFTFNQKPSIRSFLRFPIVSIGQLIINYLVPLLFVYYSIKYTFLIPILSTIVSLPLVFALTRLAITGRKFEQERF